MTFVEFFENRTIENLCACLASTPDKVIMIGSNQKQMRKHKERYEEIFRCRDRSIEFDYKSVNKHDLASIVTTIEEIVMQDDDVSFGLTGGDDLYLVAMGIVFERYRDKNLQMHRFNIKTNKLYDCDKDGNTIDVIETPCMSVWEYIYSQGGDIVTDPESEDYTYEWDWDGTLCADVNTMWNICKKIPRAWNVQTSIFGVVAKHTPEGTDPLKIEAAMTDIARSLVKAGVPNEYHPNVVRQLFNEGFITAYEYNNQKISVTFRDPQVKRCLTKAGQVLELKVYLEAKLTKDESGNYVYYDAMNGVYIDWDGIMGDETKFDTVNEVDVILTHDMIPVFVSCKNGWVDMDELYKLNTVAHRFGGEYAKKILVANGLEKAGEHGDYIIGRARDMGIIVVGDIEDMDDDKMRKNMSTWWVRPL